MTMSGCSFKRLLLLISILAFTASAQISHRNSARQALTTANPENVGMSSERLVRIDKVIDAYVGEGKIPGAVAIIIRGGKIVYHKSFGSTEMGGSDRLRTDHIFRIASMTKPITSIAAMMLFEEGKFLLDDPASKYIPEFKNPKLLVSVNERDSTAETRRAESEVTVRHLFTHTSGIGYSFMHEKVRPLYEKAGIPGGFVRAESELGEAMRKLAGMPLLHEPGAKWTYGLSTDMLGYFVEVLSGMSLNDFFRTRIFEPLGMEDTYFYLPEHKAYRLVPVHAEVTDEVKQAEWLASYAYPVEGARSYYSGGAGLSATAIDYAKFCQMMLNKGFYNGRRIIGKKTVEFITMNHIGDLSLDEGEDKFGLGFAVVGEESASKKLSSAGSYAWGGHFSTLFWIDPVEDLAAVLMKQIEDDQHGDLNEKFQNLVYQAIIE